MNWPCLPLGQISHISASMSQWERRNGGRIDGVPFVVATDLPEPGSGIADVPRETSGKALKTRSDEAYDRVLPKGTVLYSTHGSIGRIGIANTDVTIDGALCGFTPCTGITPRYLAHALRFLTPRIVARADLGTARSVRPHTMARFSIPLPPRRDQERIAEVLDQTDLVRQKCADSCAKTERLLSALFATMFDPENRKSGQVVARIGEIAELDMRLVNSGDGKYRNLPLFRIRDFQVGAGQASQRKPAHSVVEKRGHHHFSLHHLLFSGNGRSGEICATYPGFEGLCGSHIVPLRPRDHRITAWYLVGVLRSEAFLHYFRRYSSSERIARLPLARLKAFDILIPERSVLEVFERRAQALASARARQRQRMDGTDAMLDQISVKAFSGGLTAS